MWALLKALVGTRGFWRLLGVAITLVITGIGSAYLICSFGELEWNPLKWGVFTRIALAFFSIILMAGNFKFLSDSIKNDISNDN